MNDNEDIEGNKKKNFKIILIICQKAYENVSQDLVQKNKRMVFSAIIKNCDLFYSQRHV
jgi:hypothetical protein